MAVYLISYDLVAENRNADAYKPLWDELRRLGAQKIQFSLWLVKLDNTPADVLSHFEQYVDGDDRIWVCEMFKDRYAYNRAFTGTRDWLNRNLP